MLQYIECYLIWLVYVYEDDREFLMLLVCMSGKTIHGKVEYEEMFSFGS